MSRSGATAIFVIVAVAAVFAGAWPLILSGPFNDPRLDESTRGLEEEPDLKADLPSGPPPIGENSSMNGSLLYGPQNVEDTNILFNLTNHSDKDQAIKVTFSRDGTMPMAFEARAEFYDLVNHRVSWFAGEASSLANNGIVLTYEDFSHQVPFSIWNPKENLASSGEVKTPPGSHHIVVNVYDVDVNVTVEILGNPEAVTLEVVREASGMNRVRWAHVEGHWDEISQEISASSQVGVIEASMRVNLSESYRYVILTSAGDYNELRVIDSEGNECESVSDTYSSPTSRFLWSIPSNGEVSIEAKNVAGRGVPVIMAHIIDLPIEFPQSMDGCWTHDDPP